PGTRWLPEAEIGRIRRSAAESPDGQDPEA
ncbi:MAG: hypothetical protein ACI88C_001288, partial [Acidimicrobiales bacterium]